MNRTLTTPVPPSRKIGGGLSQTLTLSACLVLAACGGPAQPAGGIPGANTSSPEQAASVQTPIRTWGYISLPNGNQMRYTLLLPRGGRQFPLLVEYDGYSAGSNPNIGELWVDRGYAVLGLNIPGTGCSTGENRVFDASVGAAGAFAIEWAARQPWSNGRVGMIGYSYSGFSQLWVAAQRPKSLLAITPSKDVADPYRDVAYPGGILNVGFPQMWWKQFPEYWREAAEIAAQDGDTQCAKTVASNIDKAKRPDLDLHRLLAHPYADGPYSEHSVIRETARIDIPTLGVQSWQDEQTGTRAGYYEDTIDPRNMWLVSANGDHHTDDTSTYIDQMLQRFLAHYVKGEDNGFENEPHVRLLQEMQVREQPDEGLGSLRQRAVVEFPSLPVRPRPMRLWLQPDGTLADARPGADSAPSRYRYPVPSPAVNDPDHEGWPAVAEWQKAGQLTFTTAALPQDLSFYGEGSADLWISATAKDTDLQVTLSEVRPDGQEMFVQRGWLRASKRALDPARSSELRPFGHYTQAALNPLKAHQANLTRIEINKFAHVFRAGSSLRLTIDTPSQTGYWKFGHLSDASTNSIWHDRQHPSSLVLGYLPYTHASGLPDCVTTLRQPCRANAVPVPAGVGPDLPR